MTFQSAPEPVSYCSLQPPRASSNLAVVPAGEGHEVLALPDLDRLVVADRDLRAVDALLQEVGWSVSSHAVVQRLAGNAESL